MLTARGQRSRYLGPTGSYDDQVSMTGTNLQVDTLVTDLHNRKVVEKLLASKAGPGTQARQMVDGYAAGVNAWLSKIGGAAKITDPSCRGAAYIKPDATDLDIWYGVYLANLIASTGHFLPQITEATPPSPSDPGIPELPVNAAFQEAPTQLPDQDKLLAALGKDPKSPFGSNATAVGGDATTTGRGMVLGNPHFPWRGRYRFTQQQLTIPGRVRRRRRQPDRLTRRQHRLEQGRGLEPHRLDGLPVHAVRVPDAREPHVLPDHRGVKQLDKRDVEGRRCKNADGSLSTVTGTCTGPSRATSSTTRPR